MPTTLCSCTCGRQVFDSYVQRGQSARLSLPGDSVHLARKVACTKRFMKRRPDLAQDLKRHLRTGKQEGRGSGAWTRALEFVTENAGRPPTDVWGSLGDPPGGENNDSGPAPSAK